MSDVKEKVLVKVVFGFQYTADDGSITTCKPGDEIELEENLACEEVQANRVRIIRRAPAFAGGSPDAE